MTEVHDHRSDVVAPRQREIRFWGSAARLVVGTGMIVAVFLGNSAPLDLAAGLILLPLVEIALLALRGMDAPPLRLYGVTGHLINWGIGIAAFVLVPGPALVFYGVSILLALVRGYAGCEIAAISNWLRGRDDQIVCPVFSPIDHAEARRAEVNPAC